MATARSHTRTVAQGAAATHTLRRPIPIFLLHSRGIGWLIRTAEYRGSTTPHQARVRSQRPTVSAPRLEIQTGIMTKATFTTVLK